MKKKIVIGIAGGSGSGKTTLAKALIEKMGINNVSFVQQDSYYSDQSHLTPETRNKLNFDHPDIIDNDHFIKHVQLLTQGKKVDIPIYDFSSHTRLKRLRKVISKDIIILEGILLFSNTTLRDLINLKVFVYTDSDIRFIRRLQRDVNDRGRTMTMVIQQYLSSVRLMHKHFVEPTKKYADIVVSGNNSISKSVQSIINAIGYRS